MYPYVYICLCSICIQVLILRKFSGLDNLKTDKTSQEEVMVRFFCCFSGVLNDNNAIL